MNFSHNTHLYFLFRSILPKRCRKTRLFFNPFFNGSHSSTLVQIIGDKSPFLCLFFSQIRLARVRSWCKDAIKIESFLRLNKKNYVSIPKVMLLKQSLGFLFNLGVYKLWIWISFLSFVPWHSFWWELKNSAINKFSLSNIILARYMKISYMYVMWNSAEKGQILKKLSREGPPGTRTLYSPLGRAGLDKFQKYSGIR